MNKITKGFVCPQWATTYWDEDNCTIEKRVGGGYAVVCHTTQVTVYIAPTKQECIKWLQT